MRPGLGGARLAEFRGYLVDFSSPSVGLVEGRFLRLLAMCKIMCIVLHMATNLAIDPQLLDAALSVSDEKTKKATVTRALQEFIARRKQREIAQLFDTLNWNEEFDYKAERSRNH